MLVSKVTQVVLSTNQPLSFRNAILYFETISRSHYFNLLRRKLQEEWPIVQLTLLSPSLSTYLWLCFASIVKLPNWHWLRRWNLEAWHIERFFLRLLLLPFVFLSNKNTPRIPNHFSAVTTMRYVHPFSCNYNVNDWAIDAQFIRNVAKCYTDLMQTRAIVMPTQT